MEINLITKGIYLFIYGYAGDYAQDYRLCYEGA